MIEIEQLERTFTARGKPVHALKGINLSVPDETFFTLLGPSGCGKTTTLRSVAGLERPDGGEIRIGIEQVNGATAVNVTDTGTGIRKEDLPRIFDRFYRGDPSRSSAGTGLGLSLVRSIMELHEGSASVESESKKGTKVTLRFPRTSA